MRLASGSEENGVEVDAERGAGNLCLAQVERAGLSHDPGQLVKVTGERLTSQWVRRQLECEVECGAVRVGRNQGQLASVVADAIVGAGQRAEVERGTEFLNHLAAVEVRVCGGRPLDGRELEIAQFADWDVYLGAGGAGDGPDGKGAA